MSTKTKAFETYINVKFPEYNCEFKFYAYGVYDYTFGYFDHFEIELDEINCPEECGDEIEEELEDIAREYIENNIPITDLVEREEIKIEI